MATFTITINSSIQGQAGVAIVDNCVDTTGDNTAIFYTGVTDIENGVTLYTDAGLTTLFVGYPLVYYIGTSSNTNGTIDLTTTTNTSYTFNVSDKGVVSNVITCLQ